MVEAVRRCREHGLMTALLTNNFVGLDGDDGDRSDDSPTSVARPVRRRSSSRAEVGVRKPDPASTSWRCDELGVEPTEAVFLDDLGVNLKPARAMGMTTIKVVDPAAALAELEAVVGFPLV